MFLFATVSGFAQRSAASFSPYSPEDGRFAQHIGCSLLPAAWRKMAACGDRGRWWRWPEGRLRQGVCCGLPPARRTAGDRGHTVLGTAAPSSRGRKICGAGGPVLGCPSTMWLLLSPFVLLMASLPGQHLPFWGVSPVRQPLLQLSSTQPSPSTLSAVSWQLLPPPPYQPPTAEKW